MNDKGYVYLICDPGNDWFKIGVTRGSIQRRIKKLQTGNGSELFITKYFQSDYPFKLEKLLHNRFGNKRVLNEWFDLSNDDITNFEDTCKELSKVISSLKENPFYFRNR